MNEKSLDSGSAATGCAEEAIHNINLVEKTAKRHGMHLVLERIRLHVEIERGLRPAPEDAV